MAVLFALGLSSGLPLLLTADTLQAWMTKVDVDLHQIALLGLVGLAYNLKFAWAPLLDRFRLPLLGRRRGWVLAFQLALVAALVLLGQVDPITQPDRLAALAVAVAFLSASQDIVLDAYANDVLEPHERGAGSAVYVLGYRAGMLIAGTLALVLAKRVPWQAVYAAMAAVIALCMVATLVAEEPAPRPDAPAPPRRLRDAYIQPIADLLRRLGTRRFALGLAFAATYELGYFFAKAMMSRFLLRKDGGFDLDEVALVNKAFIFLGVAIGGAIGGVAAARLGVRRLLVPFALVAAATHLLYVLLALAGHSLPMLCTAVLVDSIADAMVSSVFIAVLYSMCVPAFSATQVALLTSLSSIGQRAFAPFLDRIIEAVGWPGYFATAAVLTIPGIWLARYVARDTKFAPATPSP
jgi:PAT family beta-lactamase induction signal transducer AmpG